MGVAAGGRGRLPGLCTPWLSGCTRPLRVSSCCAVTAPPPLSGLSCASRLLRSRQGFSETPCSQLGPASPRSPEAPSRCWTKNCSHSPDTAWGHSPVTTWGHIPVTTRGHSLGQSLGTQPGSQPGDTAQVTAWGQGHSPGNSLGTQPGSQPKSQPGDTARVTARGTD